MQALCDTWIILLAALAVGAAVGLFFFGGLQLTVQRLPHSTRPGLLAAASFTVRSAGAAGSFWWIAGGHGLSWAACLLGFLLSRRVLVRRAQLQLKNPNPFGRPVSKG